MKETNIGKYVIVRGDRSGVFAGILADRDGESSFFNIILILITIK